MARGFNSVQLVGTLTQAPEMKYTAGGLAILELNLAGSDRIVGNDGQPRDLTWYQRVTVFGKQAEYLSEQLEVGTPVFCRRSPELPHLGRPQRSKTQRAGRQRRPRRGADPRAAQG